jgi:hypothetical protein
MSENSIRGIHLGRFSSSVFFRPVLSHLCCMALPLLMLLVFGLESWAAAEADQPKPQMLIVVGAPGEAEYDKQFTAWAAQWSKIGEQAGAVVTQLGTGSDGSKSDLEQLGEAILGLKRDDSQKGSPDWLILIGHGTFQANVAKFNLRGPDVSSEQLSKWLSDVQHRIVVINVASASGPFVNAISGENRIVVTATRSGQEQNFARFGEYLPEALGDPNADLDHDGEVSLLEAVLKASNDTKDFYLSEGRIQTEHALLDDNGDKLGTPAEMLGSVLRGTPVQAAEKPKSNEPPPKVDGDIAATTILIPSSTAAELLPEERERRASIDTEVRALRRSKNSMKEVEYFEKLEARMLELAAIYDAAEKRDKAQTPPSSP